MSVKTNKTILLKKIDYLEAIGTITLSLFK